MSTLGTNLIVAGGGAAGPGHPTTGNEFIHIYVQTSAPVSVEAGGTDPLAIGDVWSDTTANLLKRCSGINPDVFTSVEGGGVSFAVPSGDVDIGDTAVEGSDATATRSDHQHAFPAPASGYPVDTDFGAEADGSATTPARSDHRHNIPAPAAPTTVDIGDSAATGSGGQPSREDHVHGVTAPGAGYPLNVDFSAESDGTATTPARSDHRHTLDTPAAPTGDVDIGDAAAVGTGGQPSREDHQHAFPAPAGGYPLDVSDSEADGSATTAARSDHVHALPSTLATSHDIEAWISGAAMKGTATAGAGDADKLPETRELATNDVNIDFIAFDQTTSEHAFFQWAIPTGWNEGTITYVVYWTAASGSGTFTASLKALARGNDDALDTAFGTAVTVTDTLLATDDQHISPESAALTIGGTPAEGDLVMFDLSRDIADTLSADAQVMGVKITYTRNSYTD